MFLSGCVITITWNYLQTWKVPTGCGLCVSLIDVALLGLGITHGRFSKLLETMKEARNTHLGLTSNLKIQLDGDPHP